MICRGMVWRLHLYATILRLRLMLFWKELISSVVQLMANYFNLYLVGVFISGQQEAVGQLRLCGCFA